MSKVEIYTDGSCLGNPGKGGIGIVLKYGKYIKEISQGYKLSTNNRMELFAAILSLEALTKENLDVELTTDSKYVVDAIGKGWVFNWEKKDFKGRKNSDLWKRLLVVYRKHNVKFFWVRGHNNHPENTICDKLAVKAAQSDDLLIDEGYEYL